MGPRAGLDGRKISSLPGLFLPTYFYSILDRPTRSSVAIPTELPGPLMDYRQTIKTLRNRNKLNFILIFNPYRAVNTLCLCYKYQSVNVI